MLNLKQRLDQAADMITKYEMSQEEKNKELQSLKVILIKPVLFYIFCVVKKVSEVQHCVPSLDISIQNHCMHVMCIVLQSFITYLNVYMEMFSSIPKVLQ